MTDDQLRALVREAVSRHLGRQAATPVGPPSALAPVPVVPWAAHPSHYQYVALANTGETCVIEPAVACNHCGYCKSHGH